ncbi:MAG TPA: PQ-loop domain-containing transporter [Candidatus Saccharimonadales bacterium]|nr:PQ-loop domain-containing transporter [Candidatus Saccharimonadales bacterium]
MNPEIIGFTAGMLTAGSLLPQVARSVKIKSTVDISLHWSVINFCGQALWVVYGVLIGSMPLYAMSGFIMILAATMFVLKLKYGMKGSRRGRKKA